MDAETPIQHIPQLYCYYPLCDGGGHNILTCISDGSAHKGQPRKDQKRPVQFDVSSEGGLLVFLSTDLSRYHVEKLCRGFLTRYIQPTSPVIL
ncbi:hypothetical protein E2C01_056043 [Portunus trituberculatus]|uniref:Uncharacterized protein n=1 Tax=Portunus trituberculatus TaxID=210409 RepID=A0A5B7GZA1_PORTR|nr:hypothetical protein [Portunus trituberculatus]